MNRIRWASSSALAIALGSFGCGSNSTTTKDASVDRRGTGDVVAPFDQAQEASDAGCYFEGTFYAIGDEFTMPIDCGPCYCTVSGLSCYRAISCDVSCGGQESNTTAPAGDGCNTCYCLNAELNCSHNTCLDAGTGDFGGTDGSRSDAGTADAVSAGEASVPTSDAH
jgi:hypothetical protein